MGSTSYFLRIAATACQQMTQSAMFINRTQIAHGTIQHTKRPVLAIAWRKI